MAQIAQMQNAEGTDEFSLAQDFWQDFLSIELGPWFTHLPHFLATILWVNKASTPPEYQVYLVYPFI